LYETNLFDRNNTNKICDKVNYARKRQKPTIYHNIIYTYYIHTKTTTSHVTHIHVDENNNFTFYVKQGCI